MPSKRRRRVLYGTLICRRVRAGRKMEPAPGTRGLIPPGKRSMRRVAQRVEVDVASVRRVLRPVVEPLRAVGPGHFVAVHRVGGQY